MQGGMMARKRGTVPNGFMARKRETVPTGFRQNYGIIRGVEGGEGS